MQRQSRGALPHTLVGGDRLRLCLWVMRVVGVSGGEKVISFLRQGRDKAAPLPEKRDSATLSRSAVVPDAD